MSSEGEYSIRFRHELGDIGPLTFKKDTTVLRVKEKLLEEWPSEGDLSKQPPTYASELRLILRGKYVDASRALFDYEREMGDLSLGSCFTMHMVIRKETNSKQKTKDGQIICPCCCIQ
eukprot:g2574.t1